jgi:hypothetical protein
VRAEALLQLARANPRVLDHIVQDVGGHDLVRVVAAAQKLRYLQRANGARSAWRRCPVCRAAANSNASRVIGSSSTKLGNCVAPKR